MDKEISTFGDIKIEINKFCHCIQCFQKRVHM